MTDAELQAIRERSERACSGLYYVSADDFEALLTEVAALSQILAGIDGVYEKHGVEGLRKYYEARQRYKAEHPPPTSPPAAASG